MVGARGDTESEDDKYTGTLLQCEDTGKNTEGQKKQTINKHKVSRVISAMFYLTMVDARPHGKRG